jgi:heme/copper-type cytochrome/quinol oxidase subunit 4
MSFFKTNEGSQNKGEKQKMQTKNRLIALALMIVLTAPMIMIMATASAQTTTNLPMFLYINASPTPVGIGQTVYITLFFTKPVPTLTGGFSLGYQLSNLKINVVKPDGTNETLGPYITDTTGGVPAVEFVPSALGNYTFQGTYPGEKLGTANGQTYYLLSALSPAVTVTVQQAPLTYWTSTPMPTAYWTTPIYSSNYGWAQSVGGNWYGLGRPGFDNTGGYDGSNNNFQPYSTAPTTAHVLWTKLITTGGIPGGETPPGEMSSFAANSPLYHSFEPIILDGILFYSWYPAQTAYGGIVAVNLFNGQTLWVKNTNDTLVYGQVLTFHTIEEFGSQAFLWAFNPANNNYDILDPFTGNFMAQVNSIPSSIAGLFSTSTIALIDSNEPECIGSILIYYTSTDAKGNEYLNMWNSSLCLAGPGAVGTSAEFLTGDFKPSGTYNFTTGVEWTVPVPAANPSFGISSETNQGILLTSQPKSVFASSFGAIFSQWSASYETDMAYNPITGAVLFGPTNQTLINNHSFSIMAGGGGVYVSMDKDTQQVYGYSMTTGSKLWGPTQLVVNGLSTLFGGGAIAYGQVYIWDIGGYVNAVNLTTGKLDWTWTRGSAGYNTPYGVYPNWVFGTQSIADGMLFLSEGRCYDPPLFPGGEKIAINCTTGNLVWAINGAFQRDPSPIADGELLGWNGYDGQIYGFGIGPSQTTVTAPNPVTTVAAPIVITGSVTDISAGSKQVAVAANFPNGLPCVSDASMQSFMQAVYEQQPMPTNTTGVPVTIYVLDSNNNYRSIGTTTTNANGFYSLIWRPDIIGNYTVTASFAGTQSYYGSTANTAFYVNPAASTTAPTASPISGLASNNTLMYGLVSIIIVIIIIGAVLAILVTRKRP